MSAISQEVLQDGWQARLHLDIALRAKRSVMVRAEHEGPLRVQRAFYPEAGLAHIYILHPPGGVVGGDQLSIKVNVQDQAGALLTTPGAGKFYLSAGARAGLEQQLHVGCGASLEWLPQENIFFAGARVRTRTDIHLQADARFIGWDITCLGRPASDERFSHGEYDARLSLYREQTLVLIERQRVLTHAALQAAAGLRDYPLHASFIATPCTEHELQRTRALIEKLDASLLIGASLLEDVLIVRLLSASGEALFKHLLRLWQLLRPMILGRDAVLPRIWAT